MPCLDCLQYHYASLIALVQNNQQGEGKPERKSGREGVSGCIPLVPSYLFLNNPPYSLPSTLPEGEI
jgi:hypothetical protein